jgi:hypothetical protein
MCNSVVRHSDFLGWCFYCMPLLFSQTFLLFSGDVKMLVRLIERGKFIGRAVLACDGRMPLRAKGVRNNSLAIDMIIPGLRCCCIN